MDCKITGRFKCNDVYPTFEIQFILDDILEAKKALHKLYEITRNMSDWKKICDGSFVEEYNKKVVSKGGSDLKKIDMAKLKVFGWWFNRYK